MRILLKLTTMTIDETRLGPEFGTWIWDLGLTKISLTYEVSKVIGVAGWVPPAQFQFPKDFGWTYNLGVGLGVDNY